MGSGAGESIILHKYKVLAFRLDSPSSVCPGRDLADLSLFTLLATSLAVFDIRKPTDANGRLIEQVSEWTPGLISRPKGFRASITPRSEKATALLRAAELEMTAGREKSDAETLLGIKWENSTSKLH